MVYAYSDNFIIFITTILFLNILNVKNYAYSTGLNTSEEIKSIFNNDQPKNDFRELVNRGNYAEGGLVKEPNASLPSVTKKPFLKSNKIILSDNIKESLDTNLKVPYQNSSLIQATQDNYEWSTPVKLKETDGNLLLGMPEVTHDNGTSSIKPRKGVSPNKIVPRKGVGLEDDPDSTFIMDHNCSWITMSECREATSSEGRDCFCCKSTVIESILNCSNCYLANSSLDETYKCQSICCEIKKINLTKSYRLDNATVFKNITFGDIHPRKIIKKILHSYADEEALSGEIELNLPSTEKIFHKSKLKPEITKVPYDVEIVTSLNSSKEIILPIAASIFLVPAFVILIYLTWKRTKDYWEKRYYRRMDFLIDGMYND